MSRIIKHPNQEECGFCYLDTKNNLVMPWYTIGCLEWLIALDLNKMSVFEYGCGRSSLWWQKESKYWNGVDDDKRWSNGGKVTQDKKQYLESSLNYNYDIIIIDGIYRDECTEYALKCLNKDGYLIYDNWEQQSTETFGNYWNRTKELLKSFDCTVYKQPEHVDWKTAVFCKEK